MRGIKLLFLLRSYRAFVSIMSFQKDHFRKTIPALIIIEEKGKRGNVKVTLRGSALAYS